MSLGSRTVPTAALEPAAELVDVIVSLPTSQNVAIILPGLWSLDEVLARLAEHTPTLGLDLAQGQQSRTCALAAALDAVVGPTLTAAPLPVADRLEQWSRDVLVQTGSIPWVVAESAHLMDGQTAALLQEFSGRGWLRLLLPMRHSAEGSDLSKALQEAGSLAEIAPRTLRERTLEPAVRAWGGTRVSTTAQRRIRGLSGGHVALARKVVDIAAQEGVFRRRENTWMWEPDETSLYEAVQQESAHLLSGLTDSERKLLTITAVAGRIPEQWAVLEFSDDVVLSLRRQGILGPDYKARLGSVDLRVEPEILREAIRRVVRTVGAMTLWYEYGKRIPRTTGSALCGSSHRHCGIPRWCAESLRYAEDSLQAC